MGRKDTLNFLYTSAPTAAGGRKRHQYNSDVGNSPLLRKNWRFRLIGKGYIAIQISSVQRTNISPGALRNARMGPSDVNLLYTGRFLLRIIFSCATSTNQPTGKKESTQTRSANAGESVSFPVGRYAESYQSGAHSINSFHRQKSQSLDQNSAG